MFRPFNVIRIFSFLSILSLSLLTYAVNNYDVNGDGEINAGDLILLQQELLTNPYLCPVDVREPNESETAFAFLGNVSGADSQGSSLSAVYAPPDDEDWFVMSITDNFLYVVDPAVSVGSVNPLSVCIYYECNSGGASVLCQGGSTPDISPGGKTGCCITSPGSVQIEPICSGGGLDSGNAYIRISEGTGTPQCTSYNMNWHP